MIDLTRINDIIKFTFDNQNLLIYSSASIGKNDNIHAFKSYVFKITDIFEKVSEELETPLIFILDGAKKITQLLRFYLKFEGIVELKFYYNEDNIVEKLSIKNEKLKDDVVGSPIRVMRSSIDIKQIEESMNTELSDFSFNIQKNDFDILKAKSTLEKDNDVYYLSIKDKKLYIGELRSSILIDEIDYEIEDDIRFPKKYFNTLNFEGADSLKIWVFEQFILALSSTTNLLITTEII